MSTAEMKMVPLAKKVSPECLWISLLPVELRQSQILGLTKSVVSEFMCLSS